MSFTIASRLIIEAEDEAAAYALLRRIERCGARWRLAQPDYEAREFDIFTEQAEETRR